MQWKVVEFGNMTDSQLAVAIILFRLEQPLGSTLMKLDSLRHKLAEVGLAAEEWNIFVSCSAWKASWFASTLAMPPAPSMPADFLSVGAA